MTYNLLQSCTAAQADAVTHRYYLHFSGRCGPKVAQPSINPSLAVPYCLLSSTCPPPTKIAKAPSLKIITWMVVTLPH